MTLALSEQKKLKPWQHCDAWVASSDCTVGNLWYVLGKETCKRMCDCNRGGVEECWNRAQENTFFWENSRLGLQSYTDTSQEEWCRAGGKRRREEDYEKESGKGEKPPHIFTGIKCYCTLFSIVAPLLLYLVVYMQSKVYKNIQQKQTIPQQKWHQTPVNTLSVFQNIARLFVFLGRAKL